MQEKTIQTKACKKCSANFDITDKDLEFYKKISPKFPSPQPSPLGGEGAKGMIGLKMKLANKSGNIKKSNKR